MKYQAPPPVNQEPEPCVAILWAVAGCFFILTSIALYRQIQTIANLSAAQPQ